MKPGEPQRPEGGPVERVVPWVVSIGLHAGLIGLGFLLTWTVVALTDAREQPVIVAEFDALHYDPLEPMDASLKPAESRQPAPAPAEPLRQRLAEQLAGLEDPTLSLDLDLPAPPAAADFLAPPGESSASFAGLTTTNARSIVYVIDASGSMIGSLPIVLEELARSLSTLTEQQTYSVIFFQRNGAVIVPPGRLRPATADARRQTMEWIDDHVIPAGRSNPIEALGRALGLHPDVVFLLSEDITGSGEFEIDQADLLSLLDRLNPADGASGRRPTRISCVQFLDPDPLETLRRIAQRHGGPGGYRFLSRVELGLDAPP